MSEDHVPKPKRRKRGLPPGLVKRGRKYHADFMHKGRRIRKPLSSDLAAAKQMLTELRSRADKNDLGLLDNSFPWADLRTLFLAWAKQHVRDWRQYEHSLELFERFTPVTNVNQVSAQVIDRYRTWRLDQGVTPRTVNREVGTISNMLNKGVKRFKVIANNAIAEVRPLKHLNPTKVRRSLSAEEVRRIFQHCPLDLLPVIRLYVTTGLRRDELVHLRFDDVDWESQTLTVREAVGKGGKRREVPLEDTAMRMLRDLYKASGSRPDGWPRDLVFLTREGNPLRNNLLRRFYVICRRAGIDDAHPNGSVDLHALRVTFTTLSLEGGASPKAVQAILGHSTLGMTMGVYAKATDRAKWKAVDALPFASASGPHHLIEMDRKAVELSQNSHKSDNRELPNAG